MLALRQKQRWSNVLINIIKLRTQAKNFFKGQKGKKKSIKKKKKTKSIQTKPGNYKAKIAILKTHSTIITPKINKQLIIK